MIKTTLHNLYGLNKFSPLNSKLNKTDLTLLKSTFSSMKLNDITITSKDVPQINIKRNQMRLTNTVKAITLFIQVMSALPNSVMVELATLLHKLELMYFRDPLAFVRFCKLMSNWYKVNMSKRIMTQDAVPDTAWNEVAGVPVILVPLAEQISNIQDRKQLLMIHRLVLSIFDIYQVVLTPQPPSLNTITDAFSGDTSVFNSIDIDRALERLNIDSDRVTTELKLANKSAEWHSSSAAGPNGQAVWMAHQDAKALVEDPNLLENIKALAKLMDREALTDLLQMTTMLPSFFNITKDDPIHSKLHFIFEKGDKTRTIAILDWWTQELLSPFHTVIANLLKKLETDGTFDQDKIAAKVRKWTADPNIDLFSLDLTAATDRLPIKLQISILNKLIKIDGFANLWAKVLTDRLFTIPNHGQIRYEVGQPMGAKSSFVMLALTHHIIVQEAAAQAGFANFEGYVILGDDIVIANKLVAEAYKALMDRLGLTISAYKSIENTTLNSRMTVAEICKRLFAFGTEISPLPVKLIANVIDNGSMAYQLQEELFKRELITDPSALGRFFASILRRQSDFKELVRLNLLPGFMTGMKSQVNLMGDSSFTLDAWLNSQGLTIDTLNAFFQYTVILEQMKRMSNIIQNSETTFDILSKAMKVSDTQFIGQAPEDMVPAKTFTQSHMEQWSVVKTMHPAREVMLAEVNRISTYIMQLSISSGYNLINDLLSNLIDSLKVSVIEIVRDQEIGNMNVTRTLIDKTMQNIQMAKGLESKTLQYSVKFNPMNIIWFMRVTINGSCNVSRSTQQIVTTSSDSILQFNKMTKTIKLNSLFPTD